MEQSTKQKKPFYIIITIICAVLLRGWAALMLNVDVDEPIYFKASYFYSRMMVNGYWEELRDFDMGTGHPALSQLIYGAAMTPFAETEIIELTNGDFPPETRLPPQFYAARFTAVFLGVIGVLVTALFSPIAGVFLAINTYAIEYTAEIYLEALPILASAGVVFAYIRSGRRLNGWLILSGVLLGVSAASKTIYSIVGPAVLIDWFWAEMEIWREMKGSFWKRFGNTIGLMFIWGLISLSFYYLGNPNLLSGPSAWISGSTSYGYSIALANREILTEYTDLQPLVWLFTSAPANWHPWILVTRFDGLTAVFGLIGLRRSWQRFRVVPIWWILGMIFMFAWPAKLPQYILIVAVPVCLCASEGVERVIHLLRRVPATHQEV